MVVNFMKNSSPQNQVTKQVSSTQPVDCALKQDCSILRPVFIVNGVNITSFNYAQVADFGGRYYFITDIITLNENTLEVHMLVDPLMSFAADIKASKAIIARNTNMYNRYIVDDKFTILNYERIQTKQFPNSFPNNGNFVLIVAGS